MEKESKVLSNIIKLVQELTYSSDVAEKLLKIVYSWQDETSQGKPFIIFWDDILRQTKEKHGKGKISLGKLTEIEQIIIRNMSVMIKREFEFDEEEKCFDLAEVVKDKKAQCLSYTVLVYLLGVSLGFSVFPLGVTEIVIADELPVGRFHCASLFKLVDGRMMMVDLAVGPIISQPFNLEETFMQKGEYWELIDDQNPLLINRRFTITDQKGLISFICLNNGMLADNEQSIQYYNQALKLKPRYPEAFSNKGLAYEKLGQFDDAVACYDKAIEINPKDARTYYNRGSVRAQRKQWNKAIDDYNKASYYHKKFPEAYLNIGAIYANLGNYEEAIFEYNKAIELNPDYAKAYFHRGMTFISLRLYGEAIADLTRTIEISPDF
nr:tetratricopeptide repeat protein [Desulfobacterales bacterium]